MSVKCELELNNKKEIFEFEKVAKQANGSVLLTVGDAVILASVVSEFDNPTSEDFTPLTVQYIEKTYAASKIPGGFIKRDGKPSDFETLTSRVIDRSLRPLFPEGYVYPTTITVMVLSIDKNLDLQVLALKAASAALYTSNLPIKKSVDAVRVALINEELIINPSLDAMNESILDLYVSGTKDELLMIEMKSISSNANNEEKMNAICEEGLIEAINVAQTFLNESNSLYENQFEQASKSMQEIDLVTSTLNNELLTHIQNNYSSEVNDAVKVMAKKERTSVLKDISKIVLQDDYCIENSISNKDVYKAVNIVKKDIVRSMIVNDNIRADGRGLKDVRPIYIETNILPSAHASCLFTRGETQALVIATLGGAKDGQMYEVLQTKGTLTENFMVHYNFPGFSVGEAKAIFGVSRRELGHGNLAKRALESSIPMNFKDTIRLTSEILESNGSSSMATVCAGALCLKSVGINTPSLVAGVAMGAVFHNNKKAILTDIMGLEDHDGDMDFKVTGTTSGITALQMDIKLGGISLDFLEKALDDAKDARNHILKLMEDAQKSIIVSDALPKVEEFNIEPSKIFSIIGKGGSVIREITETFNVSIDLDKDTGGVKVSGKEMQNITNCVNYIKELANNSKAFVKKEKPDFEKLFTVDDVILGKVLRITDFGAFIELGKGAEGLLHISKISKRRVKNVNDVYDINDEVEVKILKLTKDRIELASTEF
jgi:polyribonucleotide nucleotidyltransferase